jgi:hypothetical protein
MSVISSEPGTMLCEKAETATKKKSRGVHAYASAACIMEVWFLVLVAVERCLIRLIVEAVHESTFETTKPALSFFAVPGLILHPPRKGLKLPRKPLRNCGFLMQDKSHGIKARKDRPRGIRVFWVSLLTALKPESESAPR